MTGFEDTLTMAELESLETYVRPAASMWSLERAHPWLLALYALAAVGACALPALMWGA